MASDSFRVNNKRACISPFLGLGCMFVLFLALSCTSESSDGKVKVSANDSLPFMHSVGVSTLISDSGVIRYHLVAEEWDIYTPSSQPPTWKFKKGLLMQRLDEKLDVDLYVQADTAYLHKQSMWELRGRVRIRNVQGTKFNTEELYWDLDKHEMWNHAYITIITPERTLEGTEFRSNEQMTQYSVMNSKGNFPMSDAGESTEATSDTIVSSEQQLEETTPKAPTHNIKPRPMGAETFPQLAPAPNKYKFKEEDKKTID